MVTTRSLESNPSVPGPEYFEAGWKKVTNASKVFDSNICLRPTCWVSVTLGLSSPYPSNRMQHGGSVFGGG